MVRPWESLIIGFIGGVIGCLSPKLVDKMKVDDPVGAVAVHGVAGVWVSSYS